MPLSDKGGRSHLGWSSMFPCAKSRQDLSAAEQARPDWGGRGGIGFLEILNLEG